MLLRHRATAVLGLTWCHTDLDAITSLCHCCSRGDAMRCLADLDAVTSLQCPTVAAQVNATVLARYYYVKESRPTWNHRPMN